MHIIPLFSVGILLHGLALPVENGHAYLDPGSGSFILQLLLAALLGAAFLVKAYWGKIKAFFNRRASKGETKQSDE
jgi:hypothetical protein